MEEGKPGLRKGLPEVYAVKRKWPERLPNYHRDGGPGARGNPGQEEERRQRDPAHCALSEGGTSQRKTGNLSTLGTRDLGRRTRGRGVREGEKKGQKNRGDDRHSRSRVEGPQGGLHHGTNAGNQRRPILPALKMMTTARELVLRRPTIRRKGGQLGKAKTSKRRKKSTNRITIRRRDGQRKKARQHEEKGGKHFWKADLNNRATGSDLQQRKPTRRANSASARKKTPGKRSPPKRDRSSTRPPSAFCGRQLSSGFYRDLGMETRGSSTKEGGKEKRRRTRA